MNESNRKGCTAPGDYTGNNPGTENFKQLDSSSAINLESNPESQINSRRRMNPEIRPGTVHVYRKAQGRGLSLVLGLEAKREEDGAIRIELAGTGNESFISSDRRSIRYDPMLFGDLRGVMVKWGCWPFGDEGSEKELAREAPGAAKREDFERPDNRVRPSYLTYSLRRKK
jgi:hypothetical protein